ncbi:alpha-mannosidase [Cerasicoccus frondis]|uniref:alpha-mannosidase n=1 Tax=Cerasicoccus frondis TaxID=490090 RepID=UPI002852A903|nr:glycoside hydrolase family 38 C-terminal domain-containing protein [Cerasicoccus frondis]
MLPKHHLPQLIPTRASAAINRLSKAIWTDEQPLSVVATVPSAQQVNLEAAKRMEFHPVSNCSFWGRLFDQRWCRLRLPAPAGSNTWLFWKDQGEATLYVDDEPYYGFNVAHRHCRLPEGCHELWIQSSCIQSAIWHPEARGMAEKGSFFEGASIKQRDDYAWETYHDLKCLNDLAVDQRNRENPHAMETFRGFGLQPPVDSYSPVYRKMLSLLNDAIDEYDINGVDAMREKLKQGYAELHMDKTFARCVLTGHAHLDLVWIWPERMGELKAVNLFATANYLMGEYPEYRFAYSQPASYEAVAKREPLLYARVEDRIRSKQWQATGAMYVESDTLLACGEALARSFVLGQAGFTEINGEPAKLTWLPDVFGYSACLPQIMKQTGVEYFFTTKMTWNAINAFPYSSFIWRGNDGSEVLAHVTQDSGYVTHMTIDNIKAPMHANRQAHAHDAFLLPTGYGDGGGGATDEMLERARRLGALPGMPEMEWGHPEEFFAELNTSRDRMPVHKGECYLEYHRGTYTTHNNLKASFRGLERALQVAEAVSAVTGKSWEMETAWKKLVFAQFHDYIPGSSVWDVYVEDLPVMDAHAEEQIASAKSALGASGAPCVFNPHAVAIQKWVTNLQTDVDIYVSVPPLTGLPLEDAMIAEPTGVVLDGMTVSNELVEFHLSDAGWIDRLVWEGCEVPLSAPLGHLMIYPDRASNFEAWDIDRHVLELGQVCDEEPIIKPIKVGAHRAGFTVTRKVGASSEASVSFILESGSPVIEINVALDWKEEEHLLKMIFPTEYRATNARFGIPFGSVLRSQTSNSLQAEAMWEVPFSRYLAVFDEGESAGMYVLSESKYGASVRDGMVGVSLVRSPKVTGYDLGHGAAWPPHLTRLEGLTECSDIGQHSIKMAIGRYDIALPRERQPALLADTLFTDIVAYQGEGYSQLLESIEGDSTLIPCWVKPLENGEWILRLHEVAGQRGKASLSFCRPVSVYRTDIIESESNGPLENATVNFSPYEIVTVRVVPI